MYFYIFGAYYVILCQNVEIDLGENVRFKIQI